MRRRKNSDANRRVAPSTTRGRNLCATANTLQIPRCQESCAKTPAALSRGCQRAAIRGGECRGDPSSPPSATLPFSTTHTCWPCARGTQIRLASAGWRRGVRCVGWRAHLREAGLSNRILHVQHRPIVDFDTDRHAERAALLLVVPRNTHVRQPPYGLITLADGDEHRLRSNVDEHVHRDSESVECGERRACSSGALASSECSELLLGRCGSGVKLSSHPVNRVRAASHADPRARRRCRCRPVAVPTPSPSAVRRAAATTSSATR